MNKGLYLVALIPLAIAATVLNGMVLTVLWRWFITPTFGVPQITTIQAIGLAYVVGFLFNSQDDKEKEEVTAEQFFKSVLTTFLRPALYLLFGYVVHLFM